MSGSDKLLPPGGSAAENWLQPWKKSPATVRGRYIGQLQGKMAPVKGRRYERLAESEDQRVDPTHGAPASFSKIPRGVGIPDGSAGNGGGL
jgi:hypothetical protein